MSAGLYTVRARLNAVLIEKISFIFCNVVDKRTTKFRVDGSDIPSLKRGSLSE